MSRQVFLVAQWLRIHLPMQGTWVRALGQEDPTCCGATKPLCHSYWACTLEPVSHNYWAHMPQLLKPTCLEPMLCNKRSHCNEKPVHHNEELPHSLQLEKARAQQRRPNAAKNKNKLKNKNKQNKQRNWIDIFLKKTSKWPTDIWKDSWHH